MQFVYIRLIRVIRLLSLSKRLFFRLLAVVDVVAFGGFHLLLEVGDASLDEDVVPLDELLDVAGVHALTVEVG